MKNWQKWYSNLLSTRNSTQLQAFLDGMNGKSLSIYKNDFPNLKSSDTWQKLFLNLPYFPDFKFELENGSIHSKNDLFNICLEKSIKSSIYANIYSENIIHYIIFNRLKNTENLNDTKILKLLRELPYFWFDNCPACDAENKEGWLQCYKCNCYIETSFDN